MTLFIVAASFEDRSCAVAEQLRENVIDDDVMVLDFTGYENVGPYLYNRVRLLRMLREKGFQTVRVEVDRRRPLEAMRRVTDCVEKIDPLKVVVDLSVLPRNYLFGICRLLAVLGIPTSVRYHRPTEYGRNLSRGVGLIGSIPGFEGEMNTVGEMVLAIVLGFEGYKALHVWERIGPTRCIGLVGDPPYQDHFLEWSKKHNDELLHTIEGIQTKKLHTYDVRAAVMQLKQIYEEVKMSSRDAAFILCPLGTKLQSLACFALSYCHPDVTVVDVSSMTYYSRDYSKGADPVCKELSLGEVLSWAR